MAFGGKNVLKTFPYPKTLDLPLEEGRVLPLGIKKGRLISRGETLATSEISSIPDLIAPLPGKIISVNLESIKLEVDLDLGLKVKAKDFSTMTPMEAQDSLKSLGILVPRAPKPLEPIFISGFDPEPGIKLSKALFEDQKSTLELGARLLEILFPGKTILQVLPTDTPHLNIQDSQTIRPNLRYPFTLAPFLKKRILKKSPFDHLASGVVEASALYLLGSAYRSGSVPILRPLSLQGRPTLVSPGQNPSELLLKLNLSIQKGDTVISGGLARGFSVSRLDLGLSQETIALNLIRGGSLKKIRKCIHCGRCREICPLKLPVNILGGIYPHSFEEKLSILKDLNNCPRCGLCASVCPSSIPLSQERRQKLILGT
jgi:ferredoxin